MSIRGELEVIYPKLLRYAVSRTRDSDIGEDLVLEACTRILEREEKLEGQVNLIAYGITVIRNLINDQAKHKFSYLYNPEEEQIDQNDPNKLIDIGQALNKVGEDCQQILELFAMGYSYKQISEVFEVKVGTVMSRMSRCREKFSNIYDG